MRRLTLLLAFLLLCALPALAEQPAVDEALAGLWTPTMSLSEDGVSAIPAEEGVFYVITEDGWYRSQINGAWQLNRVKVPALDIDESADAAGMDAQLIIQPDDTVVLRHPGGELRFTLQRTDDVIEYLLIGEDGDVRQLTVSSLSLLRISSKSNSYTLSFKPTE